MKIQHNPGKQRYEAIDDAGTVAGFAAYRDRPGSRAFTHTEVSDDHEGQGVGSQLARFAVEDVRDAGLRLAPFCPFIARWLTKHPEYTGFVDWPKTAEHRNGESAR
ncbi:N-acetyltransferase [Arthrobacter gandavensis]|uniref:GNAT family N-acetyltransferase n=1 Tax=Arthrobacter gandavensis TaxID=169960 RepID=UPI00188E661C|nr:GNAT family N-acetyltransferase [Arthrobacter gandavensis]MBF4994286.1 N-acetyltransferase [Arthrobacter gandavensis]